jgi:hypothetical protein
MDAYPRIAAHRGTTSCGALASSSHKWKHPTESHYQ